MKIAVIVCRILLALMFFVFGLNGFLHFIPMPPIQGDAGIWQGIMVSSHYFLVVSLCEVIGGALLLAGRYVPLGLVFLGPVIVNILTFHLTLRHEGLGMALVIVVLQLFLMWAYRSSFAPLFEAKAPIS